MELLSYLKELGLGIATHAVYDYLKQKFGVPGMRNDRQTLESEIQHIITVYGVRMTAATVINALARSGFIVIEGSHLHGPQGLAFGSVHGGAVAGSNMRLSTDKTSIDVGAGAFIQTKGNARVHRTLMVVSPFTLEKMTARSRFTPRNRQVSQRRTRLQRPQSVAVQCPAGRTNEESGR